jgi:hypothetical protein
MTELLKRWILPLSAARLCRRQKTFRSSKRYETSACLLLLFTMEGNEKAAQVRELKRRFESDGKEVHLLYYLPKPEYRADVHLEEGMQRIESRDMGLFGQIRPQGLKSLLRREFDFLVHADMKTHPILDILLCQCRAHCRVGRHFPGREAFYELMIDPGVEKNLPDFYRDLYTYTTAL